MEMVLRSMFRSTNFMMMSFSLLQWDEKVMSSKNNRTVAVVNGPEDYQTLKVSLSSLFNDVNELIKTGSMLINGERVKLEFFLGGDLKFLLMVMGMNGASSNYACLWCLLHKDERWDTSKDVLYYNEAPKCRTLENIKKLYQSKSNNLGCINKPLLDIALDHVVPDELHLLLRITDRLLENIVEEVMEKDSVNDFNKPKGHPKGVGLTNLVKAINDCGVPFKVWYKKNADGSRTNVVNYTSLVGGQKKKLLDKLPAKFHEFLYPGTCATVCKLWTSFSDYYHLITDFKIGPEAADEILEKGKAWVELFCSLRGTRPGYLKARVTPYMHMMVYHVPFFVQKYGCFEKFSGQGVEKNNDDANRMLFHKSNKWDGAKDILCVESR